MFRLFAPPGERRTRQMRGGPISHFALLLFWSFFSSTAHCGRTPLRRMESSCRQAKNISCVCVFVLFDSPLHVIIIIHPRNGLFHSVTVRSHSCNIRNLNRKPQQLLLVLTVVIRGTSMILHSYCGCCCRTIVVYGLTTVSSTTGPLYVVS